MKVTCEKGHLAAALATAGRAVSNRNTVPILSNVLLETEDDKLKITATDLDTAIRALVPAMISENGAVAVPASMFNDLVSKLPDAPVTLELQNNKVAVRCGKSDYTILASPAEDYPPLPEVRDGVSLTLPQSVLKRMLRLTTFAAQKEETRSLFMGVLMEVRPGQAGGPGTLTLVATDTHRLAWSQAPLQGDVTQPISAIVPAKPLGELERVLRDTVEENVTLRFGPSQVQCETSQVTLVSRVLDGQFPNVEKVIPKNSERRITIERPAFLDAVRRVYVVARQNTEKEVLATKGDFVEITAESQDVGRAYEEVPITMDGTDTTIAFNGRYMMEVLNILDSEKVTLELTAALNPGILRATGFNDFLYVIMPMSV